MKTQKHIQASTATPGTGKNFPAPKARHLRYKRHRAMFEYILKNADIQSRQWLFRVLEGVYIEIKRTSE